MSTTNKVYVSNVPLDASELALRTHFAACGGVCDVEILTEASGASRGVAHVTMTSPAYASAALRLDGAVFGGQALRVSDAPPARAEKKPANPVKIVQQFRERANMAYDLDCAGVPLVLRIFASGETAWRIEARATDAADAVIVESTAETRRDALAGVVRAWNDEAFARGVRPLDGEGLLAAMRDVRAV